MKKILENWTVAKPTLPRPYIARTNNSTNPLKGKCLGADTRSKPPITLIYGCQDKKAHPVTLWMDNGQFLPVGSIDLKELI
jgi:hypothetical protein